MSLYIQLNISVFTYYVCLLIHLCLLRYVYLCVSSYVCSVNSLNTFISPPPLSTLLLPRPPDDDVTQLYVGLVQEVTDLEVFH